MATNPVRAKKGAIVPQETTDEQPQWTWKSCLTSIVVVVGIAAILAAVCNGDEESPSRTAPEQTESGPIVLSAYGETIVARELGGPDVAVFAQVIYHCGTETYDPGPNAVAINILEWNDEDALYLAEDLATELDAGDLSEGDFQDGVQVLQLILRCKGWD